MGYTHYWTPKVATKVKWKQFKETCKKLHDSLPEKTDTAGGYHSDDPLEIRSGNGFNKPEFTMKAVYFNGDNVRGLDHETFLLQPDKLEWNFCKTARKPYDLLVAACLIAAHEILGYEVRSDGAWDDWKPAVEFYFKTVHGFVDTTEGDEAMALMEKVLPEFLFEEQDGSEYREPYSIWEWVKSFFVPV
jgi:hypothetical protein